MIPDTATAEVEQIEVTQVNVRQIALDAIREMRSSGESHEMCARWISERVNAALAHLKAPQPYVKVEGNWHSLSLLDKIKAVGDYQLPLNVQLMLGEIYADVAALSAPKGDVAG